jgi:hypothetical protein
MKLGSCSLVVVSLLACSDPLPEEPSDGAERGGAAGFAGASVTGGASGAGGSGGAGSSSGGKAGSTSGSGSGGSTSECNLVPADAPDYEVVYDNGPAPAARGGTVVDGTYFATSETWFETEPGEPVILGGIRIELEGTSWKEADGWPDDDVSIPEYRVNRYFTTDGTSLIVTLLCPSHGPPDVFEYTAEGDTLVTYVRDGDFTFGITFTRQP